MHLHETPRVSVSHFGEAAAAIVKAMRHAGFEIAVVGGPVRDFFLGAKVKDVDLTTNARPDETREVLSGLGSIYDVGARFGTIGVTIDGEVYEVTTYRTEQYTEDSRKPEVEYGDTLEEDLARRDFTINAMAMAADGSDKLVLVDPHGGRDDLDYGLLRAVGDPEERFTEDPLRIVRAWRFSLLKHLSIEAGTKKAARRLVDRLDIVSRPRITAELTRVLNDADEGARIFAVARDLQVAERIFGPFTEGFQRMPRRLDPGQAERGGGLLARLFVAAELGGMDAQAVHGAVDELKLPRAVADGIVAGSRLRAAVRRSERGNTLELRLLLRKMLRSGQRDGLGAYLRSGGMGDEGFRQLLALLRPENEAVITADLPIDGHDLMDRGLRGRAIGEALARVEEFAVQHGVSRDEALRIATAS